MIDMAVLIHQLIQLFLIICIGFIAFKVKILNETANRAINKLILDITLPCMMINSVLSMKEKPPISSVALLFITAIIFYLVMPLLAFIVVKIIMKAMHIRKARQGAYMFMLIFSNIAFMGFPILQAACGDLGDTAVFYAAVLNIFFNITAFTYGVVMIGYGNTKKTAFKLKSLLSPGIIAALLAIIIYGFNISFPPLISNVINTVGNLTSPLAMIMVGAALASIKLSEIFNEPEVYVFSIMKQLVLPILLYPVFRLILGEGILFNVIFIEFLMPVANIALMLAVEHGSDTKVISKTIFISTAISLVTIPLTIYLCEIIY